ncbi:MAG TPA: hypothetical protein VIU34_30050 [Steroidobacter sp.]
MTVVAGMPMPFQQSSLQQAAADLRPTGPRQELQEDRYSLWKVAFDRARPTEISSQEHAGSPEERYVGDGTVRDEENIVAIDDREPVDGLHGGVVLSMRMIDGAQARGAVFPHLDVIVAPRAQALPPLETSKVQASAAMFSCKVESGSAGSNLAASNLAESNLERAPCPPAADSISVLLRDGSVQIVVRDAGIRDDQALHAAFVTARELTGRRDSLKELTVNGRAVYRQHQPNTQQQPPSLAFAC